MSYKRRPCCDTTYDQHHLTDCPDQGVFAKAARPCQITADGWCASHSTMDGPVYCAPTPPAADHEATSGGGGR